MDGIIHTKQMLDLLCIVYVSSSVSFTRFLAINNSDVAYLVMN